jgi:hypothetical protein
MHIDPLAILHQHPLKSLFIRELHDPDGYLFECGKLCRPEAPRSRDDLVTIAVGPDRNGLNEPLRPQTVCKLGQFRFIEAASWVGSGFVDAREGEGLIL